MNVLEKIFLTKAEEIASAKSLVSIEDIKKQALDQSAPLGFRNALTNGGQSVTLVAEVKKASPSKGLIRKDFDPVQVATAYRQAGANCLSVLTDEKYFQGAPEFLTQAKQASGLPCLRKDFICDPYQVFQARAWGADAVLLIVAGLEKAQIADLGALIRELGMDTLVEVHNEAECEVAIELGCNLVGVNNRDLADFKTDLAISERLIPILKQGLPNAIIVSESALETKQDIDRVQTAGARSVLIGTTFCAVPDIESKVKEVMGW